MISNDLEFIPHKYIQNISVKTTAKIQQRHLKTFLKTSLELNNISISLNTKIFFSYIEESNIYEIYSINSKYKNIQTQYHIFNNNKNNMNIFITNDFFVVYKNNKFYFAKENKSYEIDDILNFVQYKYKIKINSINIINVKLLKQYENKLDVKNKINLINIRNSNSILYYIFYLGVFTIFCFMFMNENNVIKTQYTKNEIIYNKNKINELIINLNNSNIYITNIDFNNQYKISLYTKNIKNIYKFLNKYKRKINIKSLYEKKNIYYMEIEIEI